MMYLVVFLCSMHRESRARGVRCKENSKQTYKRSVADDDVPFSHWIYLSVNLVPYAGAIELRSKVNSLLVGW